MSASLGRIHDGEKPTAASSSATANVVERVGAGEGQEGVDIRAALEAVGPRVARHGDDHVERVILRQERREAVSEAGAVAVGQEHDPHVVIVSGR